MATYDVLRQLRAEGLHVPARLRVPALKHIQRWKEQIEDMADRLDERTPHVAVLLVALADDLKNDVRAAHAFWAAGNGLHLYGLSQNSIRPFRRAYRLFASKGDPNAPRLQIGWVSALVETGQYALAARMGDQICAALASSREPSDVSRRIAARRQTAIARAYLQDYESADAEYQICLNECSLLEASNREAATTQYIRTLNSSAVLKTDLCLYEDALADLTRAQDYLARLADTSKWGATSTRVAGNVARLLSVSSEPWQRPSVARAFREAQRLRAALPAEIAETDFAHIDLYEAAWLIAWKDANAVDIERIKRVRYQALRLNKMANVLHAELLLGQHALACDRIPDAFQHFSNLGRHIRGKRGDTARFRFPMLLGTALAHHAVGASAKAYSALQRAIKTMEKTRGRLNREVFRAAFVDDKRIAHQYLVRWRLDEGKVDEAYLVSERTKGGTLLELLAHRTPREVEASSAHTQEVYSVSTIAPMLQDRTLAISYVNVLGRVTAFVFDNNGQLEVYPEIAPMPSAHEISTGLAAIAAVRKVPLNNDRLLKDVGAIADAHLKNWHDAFIRPLAERMRGYDHLVISPDGLLGNLPFNCLRDRDNDLYLIQKHDLRFVPSLSVFKLLIERRQARNSTATKAVVIGHSNNGELPGAMREAKTVARLLKPSIRIPEGKATRETVVSKLSEAKWLWIAAHGQYSSFDPSRSFLQLERHRWTAGEIAGQANLLNASCVVLSSCGSGRGHLTGNEPFGLVRAFLHAGADAVIGSAWKIDDAAGSEIGIELARQLRAGQPLSTSLKLAQLALLGSGGKRGRASRLASPYFWANLSLAGLDASA